MQAPGDNEKFVKHGKVRNSRNLEKNMKKYENTEIFQNKQKQRNLK